MTWAISIRVGWHAVLRNLELLELVSGLKRGNQPARLFATTGPSLRRLEWIGIFRRHLWIFAAGRLARACLSGAPFGSAECLRAVELRKALFQLLFFRSNLFGKDFCQ